MPVDVILKTSGLKKHFGSVRAVDGISLNVPHGQVYGFLGPNGSGKTTTIGMILGLIHPTAGEVSLFGSRVSPAQTQPLQKVGALVGAPSLVPYLSARKNLEIMARMSPNLPAGRIDKVLEIIDLQKDANRPAKDYSTGMKQRLGLGMALLHEPELLILDEPTNGMDPAGMRAIRNLVARLAEEGVTIFISSHLLHEVEQICDRVAVLKQGIVIAEGEVSSLLGTMKTVQVRVSSTGAATECLKMLPGASSIKSNGSELYVSGVRSQDVVAHLTSNGIIPSEVTTGGLDLESVFLELTDGS